MFKIKTRQSLITIYTQGRKTATKQGKAENVGNRSLITIVRKTASVAGVAENIGNRRLVTLASKTEKPQSKTGTTNPKIKKLYPSFYELRQLGKV